MYVNSSLQFDSDSDTHSRLQEMPGEASGGSTFAESRRADHKGPRVLLCGYDMGSVEHISQEANPEFPYVYACLSNQLSNCALF